MTIKLIIVLFAAITTGCSEMPVLAASKTVLPSELAAHPEKYNGKHVDVRGYVVVGSENRNIFDSESGATDPRGACLGLAGPASMFDTFHRHYIKKLSGVFRQSLCGKDDICLYWCSSSGIELDPGSKP